MGTTRPSKLLPADLGGNSGNEVLSLEESAGTRLGESTQSRSPCSAHSHPLLGEGSPTKIDYRKKGTLILTSLLEDLAVVAFHFGLQGQRPEQAVDPSHLWQSCEGFDPPEAHFVSV